MPKRSKNSADVLTDKQARFVEEYLVDLNATQAAIRAGYSAKTSHVIGCENLVKPKIANAISMAKALRSSRTEITADRVLEEMAVIAFADVTHYEIDDQGHVVLAPGTEPSATRALSTVKHKTKYYTVKDEPVTEHDVEVKLWSKPTALDQLAKHLNLYEGALPPAHGTQVNVFIRNHLGSGELPEF